MMTNFLLCLGAGSNRITDTCMNKKSFDSEKNRLSYHFIRLFRYANRILRARARGGDGANPYDSISPRRAPRVGRVCASEAECARPRLSTRVSGGARAVDGIPRLRLR